MAVAFQDLTELASRLAEVGSKPLPLPDVYEREEITDAALERIAGRLAAAKHRSQKPARV